MIINAIQAKTKLNDIRKKLQHTQLLSEHLPLSDELIMSIEATVRYNQILPKINETIINAIENNLSCVNFTLNVEDFDENDTKYLSLYLTSKGYKAYPCRYQTTQHINIDWE